MEKKSTSGIMLTLLLFGMMTLAFNVQPSKSDWTWTETIYIRADGSIDPDTAPISTFDNITYTLTDNIVGDIQGDSSAIVVERDDIVIDGVGYAIEGAGVYYSRGIDLTWRSNVTVKNMSIRAFFTCIVLDSSSGNCISGNDITVSCVVTGGYGISLYSSSSNNISGNKITTNKGWGGITLYSSSGNNISGNDMANSGTGIDLDSCNNNSIVGNNLTSNSESGLVFSHSSGNNISGNNITANNLEGIWLSYSSGNNISENNIIANKRCGVYLSDSPSGNKMYHNNFINNTIQVCYHDSGSDVWDDGYPSGGNYWSNYTGVDKKSGLNQDQLGSDGIGDTPHIIDANNRDRYPLMTRWPPPEHELIASITVPAWTKLGSSSFLNATVNNLGLNDETDVELVLLINGTVVDSSTVPLLQTGRSYTLSYLWTPAVEATYNVTAYAHPVPGETSVENNQMTKFVTLAVSPSSEVQVGVRAGDWIKCTYTISGWPAGTPYPEWLKVEFLSVEGTSASVRVTMHMSDGTEQSETLTVDVVAGGQALGLSGFLIPANCTTGDCIYMTGYGNVTIEGETTRTYAGASRTVVYASFSQLGNQLTYYWDKQTGVMVEASTISGSVTATGKATETNMWQADSSPFWMQWWFYAIVAVVIVALVGAFYFLKRRTPPTPATPIRPTEGT